MGLDDPETNQAWAEEEGYEYEIWTDNDKVLGITYGALTDESDSSVKRLTRLLDENGDLVLEYNDIDVGASPSEILSDCQALFGD